MPARFGQCWFRRGRGGRTGWAGSRQSLLPVFSFSTLLTSTLNSVKTGGAEEDHLRRESKARPEVVSARSHRTQARRRTWRHHFSYRAHVYSVRAEALLRTGPGAAANGVRKGVGMSSQTWNQQSLICVQVLPLEPAGDLGNVPQLSCTSASVSIKSWCYWFLDGVS